MVWLTDELTMVQQLTFAERRQEMASFFTSSMVGSRCVLYLARGCHLSYCACRFLPATNAVPCQATNALSNDEELLNSKLDFPRTIDDYVNPDVMVSGKP